MPMQLLVTRPEPQASQWANDLRAEGFEAHALPLIEIGAPSDPAPVRTLWRNMAATRLLMFVSPAAVEWFFQLRPVDAPWPSGTLAAAPGPGTARSLLAAGAAHGLATGQILSPDAQAEQFDSEALWPVLAPLGWQGAHAVVISGGDENETKGRTWLAEQLRGRGATVASLLTYQRTPGQWSAAQRQCALQALAEPERHIWLFSSSQAIDHLETHHLPALALPGPVDWRASHALVTHPKIAERARRLGIGHLLSARPTLPAVVEALRRPA